MGHSPLPPGGSRRLRASARPAGPVVTRPRARPPAASPSFVVAPARQSHPPTSSRCPPALPRLSHFPPAPSPVVHQCRSQPPVCQSRWDPVPSPGRPGTRAEAGTGTGRDADGDGSQAVEPYAIPMVLNSHRGILIARSPESRRCGPRLVPPGPAKEGRAGAVAAGRPAPALRMRRCRCC
jgi:hypothetical protein